MHRVSRTEFRLLVAFGVAVFVAANLLALRFWLRSRAGITQEITILQGRISEQRGWIALSGDLAGAREWIARHPPPALPAGQANTDLLDSVRQAAGNQHLTVVEESFLPSTGTAGYPHADLQIKLSGGFPDVVRLLFDLQKPGEWRAVGKLNLKSEAEPSNVFVEMQIRQYFSDAVPPSASSP